MNDEAVELFNKLLAGVAEVSIQWTSAKSFRIVDLKNNEAKEFQIQEIK